MPAGTMRDENGFTPTQARIMYTLRDGKWHHRRELIDAIDSTADRKLLSVHIYLLRKVLENKREKITIQRRGYDSYYMHSRSLSSMNNG